MANLQKPILIYVSKEKCPACVNFEKSRDWDKIKIAIGDNRATFIRFHVDSQTIPEFLTKRDYLYPMIILAAPQSYYRCFTFNDKINPQCPGNEYKIKQFRFNVVEDRDGKYTWAGRKTDAPGVIAWFNKMAPQISSIDEPPRGINSGSYPINGIISANSNSYRS